MAERLAGALLDPQVELPYARVERSAPSGGRGRMRAYTGIVPDYAAGDTRSLAVEARGPRSAALLRAVREAWAERSP